MTIVPHQENPRTEGHMVVCGDDGLAHRLAAELREVYRRRVVLVVPVAEPHERPAAPITPLPADPSHGGAGPPLREVDSPAPTREALRRAGAESADALALLYEDDETNLRAALAARRLNPGLRLVVRMYNR
ncbi:NAD-binding protein, partial [Streptomyces sp. NPDC004779]